MRLLLTRYHAYLIWTSMRKRSTTSLIIWPTRNQDLLFLSEFRYCLLEVSMFNCSGFEHSTYSILFGPPRGGGPIQSLCNLIHYGVSISHLSASLFSVFITFLKYQGFFLMRAFSLGGGIPYNRGRLCIIFFFKKKKITGSWKENIR